MSASYMAPTKFPIAPTLNYGSGRTPHFRESSLLLTSMNQSPTDPTRGFFSGTSLQVNLEGATALYLGLVTLTAQGVITIATPGQGAATIPIQYGNSYNQQTVNISYTPTMTAAALRAALLAGLTNLPTSIVITGQPGGPYLYSFPGGPNTALMASDPNYTNYFVYYGPSSPAGAIITIAPPLTPPQTGTITLIGSGSLTLSYNGNTLTPFGISSATTAATIQTALQQLNPAWVVSGPAGGPWTYSASGPSFYTNTLGYPSVAALTNGATFSITPILPGPTVPLVAGLNDSISVIFYEGIDTILYNSLYLASETVTFSAAQINQLAAQPPFNTHPSCGIFVPVLSPHGECVVQLTSTAGFPYSQSALVGLYIREVLA